MDIIVYLFLGIILFYSLYAIYDLYKNKEINKNLKNNALFIIISLPFIGAFIYLNILKKKRK